MWRLSPTLARARHIARPAVQTIIALNIVWADWQHRPAGERLRGADRARHAFVIAQAAVVAVFAELQFIGLRRESLATA